MRNLFQALERSGGVAHLSRLISYSVPADVPRRAAQAGLVQRVRPGVYAMPSADPDTVRAARIGGRLAGSSATRVHGLWEPPRHPLVVEVGHSASHLRDPDDATRPLDLRRHDVRVLWAPDKRPLAQSIGVSPLADVIRQTVLSESPEYAVATIDSALHSKLLAPIDLELMRSDLTAAQGRILALADGRSEAGTESIVRVALARHGIVAVPQVRVPFTDRDRMDLLIGDRLVIECQSQAYHGNQAQRLRDLRRYSDLAALGFIVIEIDYWQAIDELELVIAGILSYVDRGLHLDNDRLARRS